MIKYKALPVTDKERADNSFCPVGVPIPIEAPISGVFLSAFEFVRLNMKDKEFMGYLKSNLGCSFDSVLFYITYKKEKINKWSEARLFKIVDEDGRVNGYTIEPFIELLTLVKHWREEHKNNKTMEQELKEKIKPIPFKESNRTLKGGENADDLRVFSDGRQSVSCWKLTFIGALKILFTRKIWLGVLSGDSQPPVWMSTDFPFKTN